MKTDASAWCPRRAARRNAPADLVLIAAGFLGVKNEVADAFGIPLTDRGTLTTSAGTFASGSQKLFCAGDARRGQSLVVHAIAEGRAAAHEVDAFLMGYTNLTD